MAVETGTATGHTDLLNKLVTFLTATMTPIGERWTLNKTASVNGEEERYLEGPGLAGTDSIHVNIRTVTLASSWEVFNWEVQGATGFDGGELFEDQPGANPTSVSNNSTLAPTFVLSNSLIEYTFVASGRRFIVISKVGRLVTSMYGGFILPYATPAEYTYPLLVAGSSMFTKANLLFVQSQTGMLSSTTPSQNYIKAFFNPFQASTNGQSSFLYTPEGNWLSVQGQSVASNTGPSGDTEIVASWPWSLLEPAINSRIMFNHLRNKDGTYILIPGVLSWTLKSATDTTPDATQLSHMMTYGEYDGVYFVPNLDLEMLDTFTISSEDYLVVGDSYTSSFNSAAAIKKV